MEKRFTLSINKLLPYKNSTPLTELRETDMALILWVKYIGMAGLAYLMGSIPWGVILVRRFGAVDIRQAGSRNIGATNVFRTAGLGLGILTLIGDLSKGALPVWLAVHMTGQPESMHPLYVSAVALCAFMGHLYPAYLKFKSGGKGVATAAGCFLIISPGAVGIALMIFILFAGIANRASVGSLAAAAALAPAVWWTTNTGTFSVCAVFMAGFIYTRHRGNIRRLISGTEPVIWGGKDK
jgi:glycerol-3-phosphate acyltransferase PlsY